jgi:hypothetical protein
MVPKDVTAPPQTTIATRQASPITVQLVVLAMMVGLSVLFLVPTETSASIAFEDGVTALTKVTVGYQGSLDLAVGPGDQLYAVWQDGRLGSFQGGSAIFFAPSEPDDRGRDFGDAMRIPPLDDDVDQFAPAISVGPDGVIHVVWQQRDRSPTVPGESYWEVYYSQSKDGGFTWSDPTRISQPNNRNNTLPEVAALPGDRAYVAWEMVHHPGTSVPLALVDGGVREWVREDLARSSDDWELNGEVGLAVDTDGDLHVIWASMDLDGKSDPLESQVFYMTLSAPTDTSALGESVPITDDGLNFTNLMPSLAVTKRSGAWIAWVRQDMGPVPGPEATIVVDRVLDGEAKDDLIVSTLPIADSVVPGVVVTSGIEDSVMVAISGIGDPTSSTLWSEVCSEEGCFSDPELLAIAPAGPGLNATLVSDSLGNVYIAWDDGADIWLVQRRNSPPGPPELTQPERFTHDFQPEFTWTFNDPDAGSSQSAYEIEYSTDHLFMGPGGGDVVLGALGRSRRFTPPDPMDEDRWHWRVRTRDELGLWSPWSSTGTFYVDRTPPEGTVAINGGAEFTSQSVVVLTLNATDNLLGLTGVKLTFWVANEPNFANSTMHEYPPVNNQVNHELSPGEGVKTVFFRVMDATDLTFVAVATVIFNETPFIIAHTPIATAPSGTSLNVTCEIMRGQGVSATLHFRKVGDKMFKDIKMESNASTYWAEVPKDFLTIKGIEYYIRARAGTGTVTSPPEAPADEPYSVEVFETTDEFKPPIYAPTLTFLGAVVVGVVLFVVWFFRIRD